MMQVKQMKTDYLNIEAGTLDSAIEADNYAYILRLLDSFTVSKMLAVNPRDGKYLQKLLSLGADIDSFVSDQQWVDAAKKFSNNVYAGYSHHPLESIENDEYDMVLVCEDMAYVDDVDAMLQEYHRLLKPSGVLIGGIWNISYASNIDSIIAGESVKIESQLCGTTLIPLDVLLQRLREIGFDRAEIHRFPGDRDDSELYAAISRNNENPVPPESFNTKIYFICAYKGC